jgi:hypothetical protein
LKEHMLKNGSKTEYDTGMVIYRLLYELMGIKNGGNMEKYIGKFTNYILFFPTLYQRITETMLAAAKPCPAPCRFLLDA